MRSLRSLGYTWMTYCDLDDLLRCRMEWNRKDFLSGTSHLTAVRMVELICQLGKLLEPWRCIYWSPRKQVVCPGLICTCIHTPMQIEMTISIMHILKKLCACMYVCMYVRTYVRMYVCIHMYIHLRVISCHVISIHIISHRIVSYRICPSFSQFV